MEIHFDRKKSFQKKFSIKNIDRRTFLVSIDGSDTAEYAFDLVQENFLSALDQLYGLYIFNSKKDSKFNYKNKKEIIEPKYQDKIDLLHNQNIRFLTEDRTSQIHPLEQTHEKAKEKDANFLVCGFTGMKGPRGDNMELTKGIDYLLKNCSVPFMLIKDKTVRKERKDGKYRWLIVFDNSLTHPHVALDKFLPLIETEKDELVAMTFLKHEGQKDFVDEEFHQQVKDNNILNYSYEAVVIDESFSLMINKKVNFDQDHYDFVILLNNRTIYSKELEKSNNFNIISKSKSNICVYNQ